MKKAMLVMVIAGSLGLALAQSGASVYGQCQGCHQPTGAGIPGAFPGFAGSTDGILASKGGREYLVKVLLYGLNGEIVVKGQKYNGAMPAFPQLKDEDIAAVLNHITTSWGNKNAKAFTGAEVKALRATKLTAAQVNAARKALGLK
jgi:mono/diheme cytochrome c family protein